MAAIGIPKEIKIISPILIPAKGTLPDWPEVDLNSYDVPYIHFPFTLRETGCAGNTDSSEPSSSA